MKNKTTAPNEEAWLEVIISLPTQQLELISGVLFASGCQGIQERENDFIAYFPGSEWSSDKMLWLTDFCRKAFPGFSSNDLSVKGLADRDWNASWREYFKTFHVNEQIVIAPAWEEYKPEPGETVIRINPQMAFGTGHHESTQLVLLLMQKYLKQGRSLLDAGTGSGILAIYGAQQGATPVVAFDNDAVALENAAENLQLNSVGKSIELRYGGAEDIAVKPYDCITANINRNILLQYAEQFRRFSKENGLLILSGILVDDFGDIVSAYEVSGWQLKDQMRRNEWLGLVLQRKTDEKLN